MTELLSNWTDLDVISMSGWSGSKAFSDGCLVFTATNGWRTFGWTLSSLTSTVVMEFDYMFTSVDNWNDCWVLNADLITYGSSIRSIGKDVNVWHHVFVEIASPKAFLGVNIRGVDQTGKSVIMKLRNVQIYQKPSVNNGFNKTGIIKTNSIVDTDTNMSIEKYTIISENFVEM